MDITYQEIFGIAGPILALIGAFTYIRSVLWGQTKPHVFTWVVWGLLAGVVFVAQLQENAGPGAWMTGMQATICLVIAILACFKGERHITRGDIISFVMALATIPIWILTKNPLGAVILVCIIDTIGFYPTFRKSFHKPHEEQALIYILGMVEFALSLIALRTFTLVNVLFAATIIVVNGSFVIMLLIRRRMLRS